LVLAVFVTVVLTVVIDAVTVIDAVLFVTVFIVVVVVVIFVVADMPLFIFERGIILNIKDRVFKTNYGKILSECE